MTQRFAWTAETLSVILIVFSSAGILLDSAYRNNPRIEAALCRLQLCATTHLVDSANASLQSPGQAAAELAAAGFREALRRSMSDPYRWSDLGEAALLSGRTQEANDCFSRAAEQAPNSPMILIRAANFQFRAGHPAAALPYTAHILHVIPDYDAVIFLSYARAGFTPSQVLRAGLPGEPRPVQSYFEYLLAGGTPPAAAEVWRSMRARSFAADPLAARYIRFLIDRRLYRDALSMWTEYLGPRRGAYPDQNLLFNGGFENEFSGALFDWIPGRDGHVEEQRDSTLSHSGARSLKVTFDGAANVDYHGASQTAVVSPGRYRLSAFLRTGAITTNQGIAFRLFDPESPQRLDVRTSPVTGTNNWTELATDFIVSAGTNLVTAQLDRRPSAKFDNRIAGTAWVDSVKLTRVN